jgi:3-oxoacyl-(acyl-carrier-protein) synthase
MDPGPQAADRDPIVVTGAGHALGSPQDPGPWLKVRKNRKFMGVQDDLAVTAAGRALLAAGRAGARLGERAGLYMAVGYIPFEHEHTALLLETSVGADGRFSMQRFSTDAFRALNPLLTFRCLSNMPAFHVSVSFDLQGPYFVTYPGIGQLYLALEEAVAALRARRVDVALVCGIAHQRNELVEHHFARLDSPVPPDRLLDGAGCLVLERAEAAGSRARSRLAVLDVGYTPRSLLEDEPAAEEHVSGVALPEGQLGPASLPVLVSLGLGGSLRHEISTSDGLVAASAWEPA